jgi:hypothetical protein
VSARAPIIRSRYLLVFCAVRRAALVFAADSLSERDYQRARAIVKADPDERGMPLPHPRVLKRAVRGDWASVMRIAQMPPPPARRAQDTEIAAAPGMPVEDAIVCFWTLNREFPSRTTLERFMAACDARLANPRAGVPWRVYLDRARELLRLAGHEPGDRRPMHGRRVSFAVPPGGRIPGALPQRRNRRRQVSRERCRRALALFVSDQREAGRSISRQAYLRWRRGTEWPAPSSMARFGGFAAIIREVI